MASASFDWIPEPGLSVWGKDAAVELAIELEKMGPCPSLTSPLERARERALPLANRWGIQPEVSAAFSEIPTPPEIAQQGIKARGPWLKEIAGQRFGAQPSLIRAWREGLIGMLKSTRSEEHTYELQSLMRLSYAVFCLKKKKKLTNNKAHS